MNETKITAEQKTELVTAVLNATGYGECEYATKDLEPACVVGQVCFARGGYWANASRSRA